MEELPVNCKSSIFFKIIILFFVICRGKVFNYLITTKCLMSSCSVLGYTRYRRGSYFDCGPEEAGAVTCTHTSFLKHFPLFGVYTLLFSFGCPGSSVLPSGFLRVHSLRTAGSSLWITGSGPLGFLRVQSPHGGAPHRGTQALGSGFLRVQSPHCGLLSEEHRLWALGLRSRSSRALGHGHRRCSMKAQLLHGVWGLPGPGI